MLLAFGRVPRLSSAVLAASLVPTTFAGHRFWEAEGAERERQKIQFAKNVSLVGGLILAAVDTEGYTRPRLACTPGPPRRPDRRSCRRPTRAVAGRAAKADAKAAKRLAEGQRQGRREGRQARRREGARPGRSPPIAAERAAELSPKVQAAAGAAASRVTDGAAALAPRAEALGHRVADVLPISS